VISGVQGVAFVVGPAYIGTRTGWQLPGAPFLLAALLLATGLALTWRVARR
jgi:hypothetical protein